MSYKKDLISVIIPVYNMEKYLKRCIDSVINNTYKKLEIICVNDGSTDNSLEILEKYKSQDSRIVIIDKVNKGLSAARNSGLKIATGEYVAFIDSDDLVHPNFFEFLLKALTEYKADMSICDFRQVTDNDTLKEVQYKSFPISRKKFAGSSKYRYYVWRRLFRHTIIKNLFFDEHIKVEDADYLARLLIRHPTIKIAYVDNALYAYYKRKGSLSSVLGADTTLELSDKLLRYTRMTHSKEIKKLMAEATIKRLLSARLAYIALNDREKTNKCNAGIRKCLPHTFSLKYLLLAFFPAAYEFYRVKDDPSMRTYIRRLQQSRS